MSADIQPESTLTCPTCGHASRERMPTDTCLFFWRCPACDARIKAKVGDCCVFCSYGSVPCPPVQATRKAQAGAPLHSEEQSMARTEAGAPTMSSADQGQLRAHELAQHMLAAYPRLDEFEQRLSLALYRELARGAPVTAQALAGRVGASSEEVALRLKQWPALRRDERQRIIGYWGLTIVPTKHRLRFGARDLYAWCAWDTLFLPALLGVRADVHSTCRATGVPVRLTVGPEATETRTPESLALSFVLPDASEMRRDVVASFCSHVHFFRSAELAGACRELPATAFVLSLGEAFEAGRLRNKGRYWATGLPAAPAGAG